MINQSDLTVITVAENDRGLLELMIRSVYRFTTPAPNIIICDQGNNGVILDKYKNDSNIRIVRNDPVFSTASNRHGEGLNKIFPLVQTKRTAIVESDCIVLQNGWDEIDFPKHRMLACKKGTQAGQPYYHVCFMVFSTQLLKHNGDIDFRPGMDKTRGNRPYKAWEDVGWRIREKVRADEIKNMDFIDCKSGKGIFFGAEFQSDEFWLGDKALLAHFGRGSNIGGKAIRDGFKSPKEQLEEWKKIAEGILK